MHISKKFLIIIASILIFIAGISIGLNAKNRLSPHITAPLIRVSPVSYVAQEINPVRNSRPVRAYSNGVHEVFESSLKLPKAVTRATEDKSIADAFIGYISNGINHAGDFISHRIRSENAGNSDSNLVKVIRVIDGDTIEIADGARVRYIGIDTPETVDPRKPVQCFGQEAAKKNKELVDGKMVRMEKDITEQDKYGRLLRYVWLGDVFVNLELVQQGFAYSYSYPPDIKFQKQILNAEEEARLAKRGLWNACPAIQKESPAASASPMSAPKDSSCLIKGNINASGEKIYHLPGCGSYAKTKIEDIRGERWFCSEAEAESAGWRKALNCT